MEEYLVFIERLNNNIARTRKLLKELKGAAAKWKPIKGVEPIHMSKNKHPMDKDMRCPKCKMIVHPDHYDDGEKVAAGDIECTFVQTGFDVKQDLLTTLYTPFWICNCGHSWEVEDLKETKPIPPRIPSQEELYKMAELAQQLCDLAASKGIAVEDLYRGLHTPTDKLKAHPEKKEGT